MILKSLYLLISLAFICNPPFRLAWWWWPCRDVSYALLHTWSLLVLLDWNEVEIMCSFSSFQQQKNSSSCGENFASAMRAANDGLCFHQASYYRMLDVNSRRLAWRKGSEPGTNACFKYSTQSEGEWRLCCWGLWDVDNDDENVWAWSPQGCGDSNCRVWAFLSSYFSFLSSSFSFLSSKEVWQDDGEVGNAHVAQVDDFINVCNQYVYYSNLLNSTN